MYRTNVSIVFLCVQISQEIGLIPEDPDYENPFRNSKEKEDFKVSERPVATCNYGLTLVTAG